GLVWAVAQHPREAQRDAARIARARLHAVESALDDELAADVDVPVVAADLEREQALGLPGEHRVGEALEGLAEHDEAGARRIAGAEVQVAQAAAAAPVAPLGGQHDEVERVAGVERQTPR